MIFWVLELTATILGNVVSHARIVIGSGIGGLLFCCIFVGISAPAWIKLILGCGIISIFIIKYVFSMEWNLFILKVTVLAIGCAVIFGGLLEVICKYFPVLKMQTKYLILVATIVGGFIRMGIHMLCGYEKTGCCQVIITVKGKALRFTGILDTGNGLIDPISKKPVSVINGIMAQQLVTLWKPEKLKMIPFSTIGEKGLMEAYEIPFMILLIGGRRQLVKNPVLAIAEEMENEKEKYDIILHPKVINRGE